MLKEGESERAIIKWDLISDLNQYNQELKLDDENTPLSNIKPQDSYENYLPSEIFFLYFDDEIIRHIIDSTNEFLAKERKTLRFVTIRRERLKHYKDLTPGEFKLFIGMKIFFNFLNTNKIKSK